MVGKIGIKSQQERYSPKKRSNPKRWTRVTDIPLHPKFQLNGNSYTTEELSEYAYTLVKEGEPYEISIGAFLLDWLSKEPTLNVRTSGSTGTPKSIVIKKEQMVNSAIATGSFFKLQGGNTALHCLPTD